MHNQSDGRLADGAGVLGLDARRVIQCWRVKLNSCDGIMLPQRWGYRVHVSLQARLRFFVSADMPRAARLEANKQMRKEVEQEEESCSCTVRTR